MKHLDVLDLSNNELTGEIPESLVHVMQLEVLNMSNNKLTGKLVVYFWDFCGQGICIEKGSIKQFVKCFKRWSIRGSHMEELLTETDRFSNSNLLAINSFGSVYKGILTDGTRVAVKIVHCDIKPSIVLLDESVTAHLSDFGISRFMGGISANSVNSTMDLKGSVGYIAPEYGLKFEWHDINSRRCLQLWHFIIGNVDKEEAN
ncbi:hypothetical protein SUGI_0457870 [Cryptomeria japonica]|nr:hypothetical protein SUGI_0457870 [Cryptomeria japonica]